MNLSFDVTKLNYNPIVNLASNFQIIFKKDLNMNEISATLFYIMFCNNI
jgi:hypothetical protein